MSPSSVAKIQVFLDVTLCRWVFPDFSKGVQSFETSENTPRHSATLPKAWVLTSFTYCSDLSLTTVEDGEERGTSVAGTTFRITVI